MDADGGSTTRSESSGGVMADGRRLAQEALTAELLEAHRGALV